jgi:hypothetical protein
LYAPKRRRRRRRRRKKKSRGEQRNAWIVKK